MEEECGGRRQYALWFFGETTSHPLSKCTWNIELEMLSFWFSSQRKIWSISQEQGACFVTAGSDLVLFLQFFETLDVILNF